MSDRPETTNPHKETDRYGKRINESPRSEACEARGQICRQKAALKEAGDYEALQLLPKNASCVRLHNRCSITGRPKGYMRQFGISRIQFREMASAGLIPGVKKASW